MREFWMLIVAVITLSACNGDNTPDDLHANIWTRVSNPHLTRKVILPGDLENFKGLIHEYYEIEITSYEKQEDGSIKITGFCKNTDKNPFAIVPILYMAERIMAKEKGRTLAQVKDEALELAKKENGALFKDLGKFKPKTDHFVATYKVVDGKTNMLSFKKN